MASCHFSAPTGDCLSFCVRGKITDISDRIGKIGTIVNCAAGTSFDCGFQGKRFWQFFPFNTQSGQPD